MATELNGRPLADARDAPEEDDCEGVKADGMPAESMELVLTELGVPGRYQLIQIIATCFCVMPVAFLMLNFVFICYEPPTTCFIANETEFLTMHSERTNYSQSKVSYESCHVTIMISNGSKSEIFSNECYQGYRYQQDKHGSMASEWDLVCGNRGIADFIQTAVNVGMTVSSAFGTYVADHFGRRHVYIVLTGATCLTEFALAFTDSVYVAIGLRLLTGLVAGAAFVIHNVVSSELIISRYRQIYGQCNCMLWSSSLMLLAGIAALFENNWKYLQLITALSGIPAFFAAFIVNETPLWYFAQNRFEETEKVIVKACNTNGKSAEDVLNTLQKCITNSLRNSSDLKSNCIRPEISFQPKSHFSNSGAKYSLFDVFVHSGKLRKIILILCLVWFTHGATYFGIFLTSSTLAGNRFLNFFLMSLLEIPSSLICLFLLTYIGLGRRTVVLTFTALSGACLLVSTCLLLVSSKTEQHSSASTAFFLSGKFAISSSYNVLSAYTPEVFPTTIRSTGSGISIAAAYVGIMLSSLLYPLFKVVPWAPGAILTFMCLLSFILLWAIPETRGKQLPTTVEEMVS